MDASEIEGTELGTLPDDWRILPDDLSQLVEVWEALAEGLRAEILALATGDGSKIPAAIIDQRQEP
jgi:hypothetical protein